MKNIKCQKDLPKTKEWQQVKTQKDQNACGDKKIIKIVVCKQNETPRSTKGSHYVSPVIPSVDPNAECSWDKWYNCCSSTPATFPETAHKIQTI